MDCECEFGALRGYLGDVGPPGLEIRYGLCGRIREIRHRVLNAWEDVAFVEAVKATGRGKLVIAGLWTEVCVVMPALSALSQGYEVYVVTDASGGVTPQAHEHAVQRMVQAGAVPVTWVQVLLELQRDNTGAYGLGVVYAQAVIGDHAAG